MARMRFPGRPGGRVGKTRISYAFDESFKEPLDSTDICILNFQNGLQEFRDLCGESEDEDFHGFTLNDVSSSRKSAQCCIPAMRKQEEACVKDSSFSNSSLPKKTVSHRSTASQLFDAKHVIVAKSCQKSISNVSSTRAIDQILLKVRAAKKLLDSIKTKHKHALQGRVVRETYKHEKCSKKADKVKVRVNSSICDRRKPIKVASTVKSSVVNQSVVKPARAISKYANESNVRTCRKTVALVARGDLNILESMPHSSSLSSSERLLQRQNGTSEEQTCSLKNKLFHKVAERKVKSFPQASFVVKDKTSPVLSYQSLKPLTKANFERAARSKVPSFSKMAPCDRNVANRLIKKAIRRKDTSLQKLVPRISAKPTETNNVMVKRHPSLLDSYAPKRSFVLPQYSRSCRAIFPNKKFLDDPIMPPLSAKRPRADFTSGYANSTDTTSGCSTHGDVPCSDVTSVDYLLASSMDSGLAAHCEEDNVECLADLGSSTRVKCEVGDVSTDQKSTPMIDITLCDKTSEPETVATAAVLSSSIPANRPEEADAPSTHALGVTPFFSADSTSGTGLTDSTDASTCLTFSPVDSQHSDGDYGESGNTQPSEQDAAFWGVCEGGGEGGSLTQLQERTRQASAHVLSESSATHEHNKDTVMGDSSLSGRKGLLELPLVVPGKRHRLPSMKFRLRSGISKASYNGNLDSQLPCLNNSHASRVKVDSVISLSSACGADVERPIRACSMRLHGRTADSKEHSQSRTRKQLLRKAKLISIASHCPKMAKSTKAQLPWKSGRRLRGRPAKLRCQPDGHGHSVSFDSFPSDSKVTDSQSGRQAKDCLSPGNDDLNVSVTGEAVIEDVDVSEVPVKRAIKKTDKVGPRIKHVCRRANLVLPKSRATFPINNKPLLSALPSTEKKRLLQEDLEDDHPTGEEKSIPRRRHRLPSCTTVRLRQKRFGMGLIRKRKGRCKKCPGCLAPKCGKCNFCLDSPKFGGNNILKKACVNRQCRFPRYSKQATNAFIRHKTRGSAEENDRRSLAGDRPILQGPERGSHAGGVVTAGYRDHANSQAVAEVKAVGGDWPDSAEETASPFREPAKRPAREGDDVIRDGCQTLPRPGRKRKEVTSQLPADVRVQIPVVLHEPLSLWSATTSDGVVHPYKKEKASIKEAWHHGFSLTTTGVTCPKAVCFLCGSAGSEKMLFCNVCCEPFHWFCLTEADRPNPDSRGVWCCLRCQFCHVCGLQSGLLQCDRCKDTYHPDCLGPAYPKRPSRHNVWVCAKCVRCKSCGATTPGSGTDAVWTYDFSLCYECGQLMDKGNFCPICRKCYSDDDWDSKMVQCAMCDAWVHARCEGLSDEMYELFSCLPQDIQYRCHVCAPENRPNWLNVLKEELTRGLNSVFTSLAAVKCTNSLLQSNFEQVFAKDDVTEAVKDGENHCNVSQLEDDGTLDFNVIRTKLSSGLYSTVELFCKDMVHVIQRVSTDCDEAFPACRKSAICFKSLFVKQMEHVFPWFNLKSVWLRDKSLKLPEGMLPDAVLPPYSDHTYSQWLVRQDPSAQLSPTFKSTIDAVPDAVESGGIGPPVDPAVDDIRQCVLCLRYGDAAADESGRLLYAGQDDWVHSNCALWSAEVFEADDGCMHNVHLAMVRGRQLKCHGCQSHGATVGCCMRGCSSNFHFMCARRAGCTFTESMAVFCDQHDNGSFPQVNTMQAFCIFRRLCVDMADIRCLKKSWSTGLNPSTVNVTFGSCVVENLGFLSPLSDCAGCLLPIDFRCRRVYWSTVDAKRFTVYTCRIVEVRPSYPLLEIVQRDVRVVHDTQHRDYVPLGLPEASLRDLLSDPTPPLTPFLAMSSAAADRPGCVHFAGVSAAAPLVKCDGPTRANASMLHDVSVMRPQETLTGKCLADKASSFLPESSKYEADSFAVCNSLPNEGLCSTVSIFGSGDASCLDVWRSLCSQKLVNMNGLSFSRSVPATVTAGDVVVTPSLGEPDHIADQRLCLSSVKDLHSWFCSSAVISSNCKSISVGIPMSNTSFSILSDRERIECFSPTKKYRMDVNEKGDCFSASIHSPDSTDEAISGICLESVVGIDGGCMENFHDSRVNAEGDHSPDVSNQVLLSKYSTVSHHSDKTANSLKYVSGIECLNNYPMTQNFDKCQLDTISRNPDHILDDSRQLIQWDHCSRELHCDYAPSIQNSIGTMDAHCEGKTCSLPKIEDSLQICSRDVDNGDHIDMRVYSEAVHVPSSLSRSSFPSTVMSGIGRCSEAFDPLVPTGVGSNDVSLSLGAPTTKKLSPAYTTGTIESVEGGVEVEPVYNKAGMLIGRRKHRPYIVETVRQTKEAIHINRRPGSLPPMVTKMARGHLTRALADTGRFAGSSRSVLHCTSVWSHGQKEDKYGDSERDNVLNLDEGIPRMSEAVIEGTPDIPTSPVVGHECLDSELFKRGRLVSGSSGDGKLHDGKVSINPCSSRDDSKLVGDTLLALPAANEGHVDSARVIHKGSNNACFLKNENSIPHRSMPAMADFGLYAKSFNKGISAFGSTNAHRWRLSHRFIECDSFALLTFAKLFAYYANSLSSGRFSKLFVKAVLQYTDSCVPERCDGCVEGEELVCSDLVIGSKRKVQRYAELLQACSTFLHNIGWKYGGFLLGEEKKKNSTGSSLISPDSKCGLFDSIFSVGPTSRCSNFLNLLCTEFSRSVECHVSLTGLSWPWTGNAVVCVAQHASISVRQREVTADDGDRSLPNPSVSLDSCRRCDFNPIDDRCETEDALSSSSPCGSRGVLECGGETLKSLFHQSFSDFLEHRTVGVETCAVSSLPLTDVDRCTVGGQIGPNNQVTCDERSADAPIPALHPLPLDTEVALRIKERSLSHSHPGDNGPFRCPSCKRVYRTTDSLQTHVMACTFYVSSSDGEDNSDVACGGEEHSLGGSNGHTREAHRRFRQSTEMQRRAMESDRQQQIAMMNAERSSCLEHSCPKCVKSPLCGCGAGSYLAQTAAEALAGRHVLSTSGLRGLHSAMSDQHHLPHVFNHGSRGGKASVTSRQLREESMHTAAINGERAPGIVGDAVACVEGFARNCHDFRFHVTSGSQLREIDGITHVSCPDCLLQPATFPSQAAGSSSLSRTNISSRMESSRSEIHASRKCHPDSGLHFSHHSDCFPSAGSSLSSSYVASSSCEQFPSAVVQCRSRTPSHLFSTVKTTALSSDDFAIICCESECSVSRPTINLCMSTGNISRHLSRKQSLEVLVASGSLTKERSGLLCPSHEDISRIQIDQLFLPGNCPKTVMGERNVSCGKYQMLPGNYSSQHESLLLKTAQPVLPEDASLHPVNGAWSLPINVLPSTESDVEVSSSRSRHHALSLHITPDAVAKKGDHLLESRSFDNDKSVLVSTSLQLRHQHNGEDGAVGRLARSISISVSVPAPVKSITSSRSADVQDRLVGGCLLQTYSQFPVVQPGAIAAVQAGLAIPVAVCAAQALPFPVNVFRTGMPIQLGHAQQMPTQLGHAQQMPIQHGHAQLMPIQLGHAQQMPIQHGHAQLMPIQHGHAQQMPLGFVPSTVAMRPCSVPALPPCYVSWGVCGPPPLQLNFGHQLCHPLNGDNPIMSSVCVRIPVSSASPACTVLPSAALTSTPMQHCPLPGASSLLAYACKARNKVETFRHPGVEDNVDARLFNVMQWVSQPMSSVRSVPAARASTPSQVPSRVPSMWIGGLPVSQSSLGNINNVTLVRLPQLSQAALSIAEDSFPSRCASDRDPTCGFMQIASASVLPICTLSESPIASGDGRPTCQPGIQHIVCDNDVRFEHFGSETDANLLESGDRDKMRMPHMQFSKHLSVLSNRSVDSSGARSIRRRISGRGRATAGGERCRKSTDSLTTALKRRGRRSKKFQFLSRRSQSEDGQRSNLTCSTSAVRHETAHHGSQGATQSHPIVHLSHKDGAVLPAAAVEEEVRETPMRNSPSPVRSKPPPYSSSAEWPKHLPHLAYEITSQDGFSCRGDTMDDAWRLVTERVQDARVAARLKQLTYTGLNGRQMFGLQDDSVTYLLEQLAGAEQCRKYDFRFHRYAPSEEGDLIVNPSGCARCGPFSSRKPFDLFGFLMSRHRQRPKMVEGDGGREEEMAHKSARRATSMELPMAMRFRKLQGHSREAVGVYRSKIHGRGLFCKRNIDNGEMIIEYTGEIIRSPLTDMREKYYESKGIGCYMFRVDDSEVIDATIHGSAARFINHSCEPNCYSRVITVDGRKHIIIFASRA